MLMGKWVAGREREDGRRTLVTSASAVRSTSTLKSEWNTNGIDREDKRERKRERERDRERERERDRERDCITVRGTIELRCYEVIFYRK